MRRDPWLFIGVAAYFALLVVALFGERLAPHESIYFVVQHGRDPRPYDPGLVFAFGSDVLGRDLLSLVLAGARTTLAIVAIGGIGRVAAGVGLAALVWWAPRGRLIVDTLAELASAVPATLVALLVVKVFVKVDASLAIFVGALLITGWAGPYRVVRSEIDRLAHLQFTNSALALGVRRWQVFVRHHLPHLVPVIATNASQQIVASLVLVAELGVLGIFVGATRVINIGASLSVPTIGITSTAISDPPEWGGMLANARTIESLWTTRWLFLVPGVAFAATATAVAALGFAITRRYARRNFSVDLRSRAAFAIAAITVTLVVVSASVPERYAEALSWAADARSAVDSSTDTTAAFQTAGLRPVGATFTIERDTTHVVPNGPATVRVGAASASETTDGPTTFHPFLSSIAGGGEIDAPLVFAGRGLSPADYPPVRTSLFSAPDLGSTIQDFADDYGSIDVRGKVVLLMRFLGVNFGRFTVQGPPVDISIANAIKRGAAAVLFVDPNLPRYSNVFTAINTNPYRRLEESLPITEAASGVPVVVLSPTVADRLLAPVGLQVSAFAKPVESSDAGIRPESRDLGIAAHVSVPLVRATAHVRSVVGEVAAAPDQGRVLVWAVRRSGSAHPTAGVATALARVLGGRGAPFILVDFDPSIDPAGNARQIAEALKDRRVALVLVLDDLDGPALRFSSPYGDLIPAIDHYADEVGARHVTTRSTLDLGDWVWPGSPPFIQRKGVLVSATDGDGDRRADAAALVGYIAGRIALGAEEAPR